MVRTYHSSSQTVTLVADQATNLLQTFHYCLQVSPSTGPGYLSELFTFTADIQSRCSLRSASDGKLAIPRTRLQFGDRAFSVAGARQWNSLPAELRNIAD